MNRLNSHVYADKFTARVLSVWLQHACTLWVMHTELKGCINDSLFNAVPGIQHFIVIKLKPSNYLVCLSVVIW